MNGASVGYRERKPLTRFAAFASATWEQRVPDDRPRYSQLCLPTGGAELVWRSGTVPVLVGPRTGPVTDVLDPGTRVFGLRLRPGATESLFGVPGTELVDEVVPLGVALGSAYRRVARALDAVTCVSDAQRRLAEALEDRPRVDPVIAQLVQGLGPGGLPVVGPLARELFVSERHLRRRCRTATGLGPKTLQRVLRFQGFVALVQAVIAAGASPAAAGMARLAAEAGYADQAHLARECQRLSGHGPLQYVTRAERHCGEHDHSAAFEAILPVRRVTGVGRSVQGVGQHPA